MLRKRNRSASENSTWKVIRNISNIYIPFTTKPPCAITTKVIRLFMASKLHNALAKKLPDIQMSEAFINCVFLAMSGGLQDAYTYFTRNEVFSNAQTGNVVLMSTHFMMGEWYQGLKYLLPFLAFGLGVFVTERIQGKYKNATRLHWRQAILLIEIIILIAVGFMPHSMDMFATIIVSFSCAMQVQAFRKVNGYSYASTMCIGNLRSGTDALSVFVRTGNKTSLKKAGYYFGIILFFAIGAGIGGNLSMLFGIHTIWISSALLSISVLLMFAEKLKI